MNDKTIAVLLTDNMHSGLVHDFFSRVLDAFKLKVEESGYAVQFLNSNPDYLNEHSYSDQILENDFAGVFIANIDFRLPEVQDIFKLNKPVTSIDYTTDGTIGIFSDNSNGIRELLKYIIEEKGHRNIAYIKGDVESSVTAVRLKAFYDTCSECGVEIPEEYVRESRFRDMRLAGRLTEELLALPVPPTCIIYPDDFAAIGGINIIRGRGLEVPKDISYCGYDGVNMVSLFDPQITTVIQDTTAMGEAAAEKLLELITGGICGDGSSVTIPTKLQKGHTVRKVY